MPVYTYRCENCGHEFDRHQSFSDNALKACPKCKKQTLQKVYRPAGVVFKGSGFYVTDKKKSTSTTTNGTKEKTKESGAKETGTKETKGESKKEVKTEKKSGESKPASKED
jgi:putative FmdB family regulatory protein